jgi:DNA modification methylase
MAPLQTNTLYYGDNLQILRDYIPDESIDLIYLDPPFNSNRSYNVLDRHRYHASGDRAGPAPDGGRVRGAEGQDQRCR